MAAARPRTRIARTSATLGVAGAVALAPMAAAVGPAWAQEAAGASDPLSIRVGANPDYTRVEFGGVIGRRTRVSRDGQAVVVRLGVTAAPDVSRLRNDPPPGIDRVETRAAQGATELVLTLKPGADARTGSADGAVWLNLYAPGKAPPASGPSTPTQAGKVAVAAQADAEKLVLTFPFDAPVGAAVFRRGEAVWMVFDRQAAMDLSHARQTGPAGDLRWAAGADYTVVRLTAREDLAVSAAGQGGTWTVTVGGMAYGSGGIEIERQEDAQSSLVARMAGSGKVIWLTDPMIGDRFAAVTALAPSKGYGARRQTVDLTLLPTAQGLAIETATDDLTVTASGDLVTLSRPHGLTLSAPSEALAQAAPPAEGPHGPAKAGFPGLILAEWADPGQAGFAARYRTLQDAAAEESIAAADDPRAPIEHRMQLARFLVGSGLGFEAIGVLNALVRQTPSLQGEPEVRGLRGAARAQIGRLDEAAADFSSGALAGDPATRLWQGYLAARNGDWAGARQDFAAGASVIDQFPRDWRARFGAAHARAALELGDLQAAQALFAYSFGQDATAVDELEARVDQARLFEKQGQVDRALAVYKAVARADVDKVAVPAKLGVVRLSLQRGQMKPDEAAKTLEGLKWRWRGGVTELEVIRTLAQLYLSQGRYREALETLRGSAKSLARLPGGPALLTDQSEAFKSMFLDGAADGLQPVQALGLFYDFRDLTPIGADGDEMVRRLARRLIDVDLLDQAAELLKHQVDERLDGVAKAQVATDLATVWLMDRQPEKALQALWSSRTTLLPTALQSERRALEARALMDLGRYDHALETLDKDASAPAQEVRADIFWKQENWADAARLYDARLGERFKDTATALTPQEESRLIRAGVGYSLARDAGAVARLQTQYRPFIERARSKAALSIALDGLDGMEGIARAQDFAALTAGADTFAGWVQAMKADFRKETQTGGNGPAAPAR